jgi:hypothetical protein
VARFGDDDRADFGLTVKYGSETTEGIFDDEERLETDEAGTQIVTTEQVLLVSSEDFETRKPLNSLAVDETITIDDVDYRVHDIRKVGDGAFKQIVVAEA